ncbi:unnamed protein product [Peronospora farinosa]|nr:unnamed protein product [Peronospora farinosa]
MGQDFIIRPFSAFDRLYFVDLTNVPSDLDDEDIFGFFERLGLHPIITPTHQCGTLTSRDRTAWFDCPEPPAALFDAAKRPLREIFFDGFDAPVYVQHKLRTLNRVTPPSIEKKRRDNDIARDRSPAAPSVPAPLPAAPTPDSDETMVAPSSPSGPAPAASPEVLTLVKPDSAAGFNDWTAISRQCAYSTPRQPPASTVVPVSEAPAGDGRMVFGIPVHPTRYELAFQAPDDEEESFEVDVDVFTADGPVVSHSITPSPTTGSLISNHSVLQVESTTLPRSGCKALARMARSDFGQLSEPEARLASITAQPALIAPVLRNDQAESEKAMIDHAILRAYSEAPASSHSESTQFLSRLRMDYPEEIPPASQLLCSIYENEPHRDVGCAYALMDLFFRTHTPSIYHDPVKVSALTDNVHPVRLRFCEFLLWSDATIHALCVGDLGTRLEPFLPPSVAVAFGLVVCDDPVSDGDDTDDNGSSDAAGDDDNGTEDDTDVDDVAAAAPDALTAPIATDAPAADDDTTMSSHSDEPAASHHTDASL